MKHPNWSHVQKFEVIKATFSERVASYLLGSSAASTPYFCQVSLASLIVTGTHWRGFSSHKGGLMVLLWDIRLDSESSKGCFAWPKDGLEAVKQA